MGALREENEKLRKEKNEAIGIKKQIKGVEERILEVRRRIGMLKSRRPAKADPLNCDFYIAKKENVVSIAKTSTEFKSTSSLMAKRAKCVRLEVEATDSWRFVRLPAVDKYPKENP